jgi:hypothetical protein
VKTIKTIYVVNIFCLCTFLWSGVRSLNPYWHGNLSCCPIVAVVLWKLPRGIYIWLINSFKLFNEAVSIIQIMQNRIKWIHNILTNMTVARQRFGKHFSEITQSTVGSPLLGSRSLGTFHSNGKTQIITNEFTNCSKWWFIFGSPGS